MNLKNLFVPYDETLALKELGFDNPCLRFYSSSANANDKDFSQLWSPKVLDNKVINVDIVELQDLQNKKSCLAPLYQQAFKWFREKHKLAGIVSPFGYEILDDTIEEFTWGCIIDEVCIPYEEAELTCLQKLIGIVKEKK